MPLTIPPAVNYPSPLNAVPSIWQRDPPEGVKSIEAEIDWGIMGGDNKCVAFNIQNNATLNFSQIVALSVDNSACGSDIQFIFPDTQVTISIPAYAPYSVLPAFTRQTQFFVSCVNEETEDVTRFAIHNAMPPPVAITPSSEQSFAAVAPIDATNSGTEAVVDAGISGTLESFYLFASFEASGSNIGKISWELTDGNGTVIAQGLGSLASGATNVGLADLGALRVRFQNGLTLTWTTANLTFAFLSPNLYYRTP